MRPLLLCTALGAALLAPLPAEAACNLVTDKAGDATIGPGLAGQKVPPLDILSVDAATGAKTMVVVLRLTTADGKSSEVAPLGMQWQVEFLIGNVRHAFSRTLTNAALGGTYTNTATADGHDIAGLTVTADAKSIRWTVPRGNVARLRAKGATLTGFFAKSSSQSGAYDWAPDSGSASGAKYKDRTASCVGAK